MVVTPTLKAAKVAQAEVGTAAGSAARLAYEYGWRWDDDGAWTRLAAGALDPATGRRYSGPGERGRLRAGDLLVVDEAGMLDQDTARAVLTIADECRVRLALMGDRHQLSAVGRGGVLDLAVGQVDADAYLTLKGLHRFTRVNETGRTVPDTGYADLTLAMRAGNDPGKVFDALLARGQIRIHPDAGALRAELAETAASSYAAGDRIAVVVDTREQAAELNTAIRDRLVAVGRVEEVPAVVTAAGEWIGVGDRIVTRRNDRHLDVANRDTWIVTAVGRGGALAVTPDVTPHGTPGGRGRRVLPAGYVTAHVQLAYATTTHGEQGETVTAAHLVIREHTGAASAYVGMTRGRAANTAHLVAADPGAAREQWLAVFARDRADLGPAHAAALAAAEAARYAAPRPLEQVLAELRAAWTAEQRCQDRLEVQQLQRDALRSAAARHAEHTARLAAAQAGCARAATDAATARQRAEASGALIAADTARLLRLAAGPDDRSAVSAGLDAAARRAAETAHPEHADLCTAAHVAQQEYHRARYDLDRARNDHHNRYGTTTHPDYPRQLADLERALAATGRQLTDTRARITGLQADPILRAQPPERLQREVQAWRAQHDAAQRAASGLVAPTRRPDPEDLRPHYLSPQHSSGPGIGR